MQKKFIYKMGYEMVKNGEFDMRLTLCLHCNFRSVAFVCYSVWYSRPESWIIYQVGYEMAKIVIIASDFTFASKFSGQFGCLCFTIILTCNFRKKKLSTTWVMKWSKMVDLVLVWLYVRIEIFGQLHLFGF